MRVVCPKGQFELKTQNNLTQLLQGSVIQPRAKSPLRSGELCDQQASFPLKLQPVAAAPDLMIRKPAYCTLGHVRYPQFYAKLVQEAVNRTDVFGGF
jgi:hypothetical protein